MPKSLFATLLIPPPEEPIDREAAIAWLTNTLPGYETLAAHLSRTLVEELEKDASAEAKVEAVHFRASNACALPRSGSMPIRAAALSACRARSRARATCPAPFRSISNSA